MHRRSSTITLLTAGLALWGWLGGAPARAACPYDLLAMCCTAMQNGNCTRWQNCCFVWESSQPGGSTSPGRPGSLAQAQPAGGGILAVAAPDCVRRCDAASRLAASREVCYGRCASAPQPTSQAAPSQIGGLATPTSTASAPSLKQLGSTIATVPMKHGSCGLDCGTHVLAQKSGNLDIDFKLEMSCPAGTVVTHVSYQPAGHNTTVVVGAPTGSSQYSQTIAAQPFSAAELEAQCKKALGGDWPLGNSHNNTTAEVQTSVKKSIDVWGQCSGWANKVKRTWPVALSLTCQDESFFVPEG